jgi:hypothetical protein
VTSPQREGLTLDPTLRRMLPAVLIVAIVLVVAACLPGGGSGGAPTPTPTPPPPLHPASPGADPVSLFAWLFTPIFQVMLIILLAAYQFLENLRVPGAIAWAIVILTLIVRAVLIPLFRRQLVSQRRM